MAEEKWEWRIVATEKFMTGYVVAGIPASSFNILFCKEFPADSPDEAKAKAMRIIKKSPVADTFKSMRNWRYADKRRMLRRRKDRRPFELILLSLNRDIYRNGQRPR